MNPTPDRLQTLLRTAAQVPPTIPKSDFVPDVMRALQAKAHPPSWTVLELLSLNFTRLAPATLLLIGILFAVDFSLSALDGGDLVSGMVQLSDQWLLTSKGF